MIRFTTSCFVRVENPQERKELIKWMEGIGYLFPVGFNNARELAESPYSPTVYVGAENRGGIGVCFAFSLEEPLKKGWGIDCGTDIPLFKALAAMNSENDHEQWFKERNDRGPWRLCNEDKWATYRAKNEIMDFILYGYRKATAEEIINHFKNQRS